MYKRGDHIDWQGIPGKIVTVDSQGQLLWEPNDLMQYFGKAIQLGFPTPVPATLRFNPDGSVPYNSASYHKWALDPAAIPMPYSQEWAHESDELPGKPCWHNYKKYIGFTHIDEYCTLCGDKKELTKW